GGGGPGRGPAGPGAPGGRGAERPAALKLTIRAPDRARKSLRSMLCAVIFLLAAGPHSRRLCLRAHRALGGHSQRYDAHTSSLKALSVLSNGAKHPRVGEASAEHVGHSLLNLRVGRLRVLVEQRFGRENHAVDAETAPAGLL